MKFQLLFVTVLCIAVMLSCSSPESEKGIYLFSLSEEEVRTNLEQYTDRIFEGFSESTDLEADRQRVEDIHNIALLVEEYHLKNGHYPLVERLSGSFFNITIRNPASSYGTPKIDEYNISSTSLEDELSIALGREIKLPFDTNQWEDGSYSDYAFGLMGRLNFGIGVDLNHHIGFSEKFTGGRHQYRIGSREDMDLPMGSIEKAATGQYMGTDLPKPSR